jgi:release factor glutamine methyltransferase
VALPSTGSGGIQDGIAMRKYLKFIAGSVLIPVTRWYLRKERQFVYDGIKVRVFPSVFHPGFFGSTRFLLEHLHQQNLENRTLLELGSGSGLISVYAAKHGAIVTAIDLNPTAVKNTEANALANGVEIQVMQSNLFDSLPKQTFDWIVINPPYYANKALNDEQLAWYCGEGFDYFKKLFSQLGAYLHSQTSTIMVLSQACEIETIQSIASQSGLRFELIKEGSAFFEAKNFLFRIIKK